MSEVQILKSVLDSLESYSSLFIMLLLILIAFLIGIDAFVRLYAFLEKKWEENERLKGKFKPCPECHSRTKHRKGCSHYGESLERQEIPNESSEESPQ